MVKNCQKILVRVPDCTAHAIVGLKGSSFFLRKSFTHFKSCNDFFVRLWSSVDTTRVNKLAA